jgi:endonuclease YncB( thermonuclease family)
VPRFFVLILAVSISLCVHAFAGALAGYAFVIDGDTIELHGTRIRLFGIDAPEASQLCRDAEGRAYSCGRVATDALADYLDTRSVSCIPQAIDQYGRTVAVCLLDGDDIGDWLVRRGLAIDDKCYSKRRYRDAEDEASKARAGVWAGEFIQPRAFRLCIKDGGQPQICSFL